MYHVSAQGVDERMVTVHYDDGDDDDYYYLDLYACTVDLNTAETSSCLPILMIRNVTTGPAGA